MLMDYNDYNRRSRHFYNISTTSLQRESFALLGPRILVIPAPTSPLRVQPPSFCLLLLIRGCLGAPWRPAVSRFLPLSSCDPCADSAASACLHEVGLDGRDTLVQKQSTPRGTSTWKPDNRGRLSRFLWVLATANVRVVLEEPVSFDLLWWLLSRLTFLATVRLLTFTLGHNSSCSVTCVAEARCVGPGSVCLTVSIFKVVLFWFSGMLAGLLSGAFWSLLYPTIPGL